MVFVGYRELHLISWITFLVGFLIALSLSLLLFRSVVLAEPGGQVDDLDV